MRSAGRSSSSSPPARPATSPRLPALLDGQAGDAVLAGRACDRNGLRTLIAAMDAEAVIPPNRGRKRAIPHHAAISRHRDRIERGFGQLTHVRRCATRYDRRAVHSIGCVHLAAAMIWMQ